MKKVIGSYEKKINFMHEFQAELFSYILTKKFDEDAEYNFNYSNIWANRILDCFELKEFEHSYKTLVNFIEKLNIN
ncbi:MAG: hypothetical protein ACFFDN_39775 [Candidatus Hodarchaeota archaeon]